MDNIEERFAELESLIAHLESSISDMSEVMFSQWKEIEMLKQQNKEMVDKLKGMAPSNIRPLSEEVPPPHY